MRLGLVLLVLLAVGCDDEPAAQQELRRELLTPPDPRKKQAQFQERIALLDANGDLLASDEKVAELTLPRGIELLEKSEHKWLYTTQRVSLGQLDRYFGTRVFTAEIDRRSGGLIRYLHASVKAAPEAPRINIELTPKDKRGERVELRIERIARRAVPRRNPSEAEIRALLEERRKNAQ